MAKRFVESTQSADKAKVRIVFAELEGSNESVQEALRTMVAAMARPVKVVSEGKSEVRSAKLLEHEGHTQEEDIEEQEAIVDDEANEKPLHSTRAPRGTGKRTDRNAGLIFLPDVDFFPKEQTSFRDFEKEKNPTNDQEFVLMAVYYLQNHLKLSKIGPNHVYTAFNAVKRKYAADIRQVIRNAKNKQNWLNFTDMEELRVATQGINKVEHEMGKNK